MTDCSFDGKPHFAACPIKADEMTIAGQAVQMPTYAIEFIGVGGGIYPGCALIFLWALKV